MYFDAEIVMTYKVWYYCTFSVNSDFFEVVNIFSRSIVDICNMYVCANKSCFK